MSLYIELLDKILDKKVKSLKLELESISDFVEREQLYYKRSDEMVKEIYELQKLHGVPSEYNENPYANAPMRLRVYSGVDKKKDL